VKRWAFRDLSDKWLLEHKGLKRKKLIETMTGPITRLQGGEELH